MKKQTYQSPLMKVVKTRQRNILCASFGVENNGEIKKGNDAWGKDLEW